MTNLLKTGGSATGTAGFSRVPKTRVAGARAKGLLQSLPGNTKLMLGIGVGAVALLALALPIVLGGGSAAQELEELAADATNSDDLGLFANSITGGFTPFETSGRRGPNTETVSAELESMSVSSGPGHSGSSGSSSTHTLKDGETLSDVAKIHYGRASEWRRIMQANGLSEADLRRLRPGTELTIPDAGSRSSDGRVATTTVSNASSTQPRRDSVPNAERGLVELGGSAGGFGSGDIPATPVTRTVQRTVYPGGVHTLRDGDNHFQLAIRYYGNEHLMEATRIQQANPHIDDWFDIPVGTRITIPALTVTVQETVPAAARPRTSGNSSSTAAGSGRHEVRPGETLSEIARRYYGSASSENVRKIQEANNIADPRTVRAGQTLIIP